MSEFNYKKYLKEGKLVKEDLEISLTPQQKEEFLGRIKNIAAAEDFEYAFDEAGNVLANIITNGEAEYIEDVDDLGYNSFEVESYAQSLLGNMDSSKDKVDSKIDKPGYGKDALSDEEAQRLKEKDGLFVKTDPEGKPYYVDKDGKFLRDETYNSFPMYWKF